MEGTRWTGQVLDLSRLRLRACYHVGGGAVHVGVLVRGHAVCDGHALVLISRLIGQGGGFGSDGVGSVGGEGVLVDLHAAHLVGGDGFVADCVASVWECSIAAAFEVDREARIDGLDGVFYSTSLSSSGSGFFGCLFSKCCLYVFGSGIWA